MGGWTDEYMEGWTDRRRTDGQTEDGWTDGGRMYGQTDGVQITIVYMYIYIVYAKLTIRNKLNHATKLSKILPGQINKYTDKNINIIK